MNFGEALEVLKAGGRVAREGWNGKDMYVYMVGAGRYRPTTKAGEQIAREQDDLLVPYKPYLALKCADGEVVPWHASQTDVLGEDWHALIRTKVEFAFETKVTATNEAEIDEQCNQQLGDQLMETSLYFHLGGEHGHAE